MHLLQQKNKINIDTIPATTSINSSRDMMASQSKPNSQVVAISLADMLQQPILVGCVFLSLGSNHNACQHLAYAREVIGRLGDMQCSPELVNPDFTATLQQPKPDYTNQCILLSLLNPVDSVEFLAMMAQIEKDCQRQRATLPDSEAMTSGKTSANNTEQGDKKLYKPKLVTLDIDLLALQPRQQNIWYRLAERYPFKAHELYGMRALKMAEILT